MTDPSSTADPVGFAYHHFGRKVAPDAPTDWLRKPALQRKMLGAGGGMLIITPSSVIVLGVADYTAFGFPEPVRAPEDKARIRSEFLFRTPDEPWLAVQFTKAGVPASSLHLNRPGDAICAYYDGKAKGLVSVRHADVRAIGDALIGHGVSAANASALLAIGRDGAAGLIPADSTMRKNYEKALSTAPDLPILADRMASADVAPWMVRDYMTHAGARP